MGSLKRSRSRARKVPRSSVKFWSPLTTRGSDGSSRVLPSPSVMAGNLSHLDNAKGKAIRLHPPEQRERDVIDGDARAGPAFQTSVVRVAVEGRHHLEPVQRLLEVAATQKWIDL